MILLIVLLVLLAIFVVTHLLIGFLVISDGESPIEFFVVSSSTLFRAIKEPFELREYKKEIRELNKELRHYEKIQEMKYKKEEIEKLIEHYKREE